MKRVIRSGLVFVLMVCRIVVGVTSGESTSRTALTKTVTIKVK